MNETAAINPSAKGYPSSDLAEQDLLALVDVARGPQHDEESVAVPLELRPLMRLHRILDGELVQVERARPTTS